MLRACVVLAGLLAALPAFAGEMTAAQARRFVVGKTFVYHCFEGTRGQGRVRADGSVVGSIQFQGHGRRHFAALPAADPALLQPRAYRREQLPRLHLGARLCLLQFPAAL
jgi:hypothetical protein